MYPTCFDSQSQFKEWQQRADISGMGPKKNYCRDCLPAYREEMVKAKRCQHPETIFSVYNALDGSKEIRGFTRSNVSAKPFASSSREIREFLDRELKTILE